MRSLSDDLLDRVLARLGLSRRPEPTLESLRTLYAAWCGHVPFDNLRKLIHVHTRNGEPFPGNTPEDFFAGWLRYGTGGTCWSGAGACQALLASLGFPAARGIGTMLVAPGLPPNHGTVVVDLGASRYLIDCSILHGEPLRLDDHAETAVNHSAWGVRCERRDGRWHIAWRPLHKLDGLECRLESTGATAEDYATRYEQTRAWSPFNYQLACRINRGNDVVGFGFGQFVKLHGDGRISRRPVSDAERRKLLVEEIGLADEIVCQLPADVPTPPPPWAHPAATP